MSCVLKSMKREILFLVTKDPSKEEVAWVGNQNGMLPDALRNLGAIVHIRCWRDLDAMAVSKYNIVTFLCCDGYHYYPREFKTFVGDVLVAAQRLNTDIRILNGVNVVLWNMDKHYLDDLAHEGFLILRYAFVDICGYSESTLLFEINAFARTHPIVMKPTMSSSANMTHLIKTPTSFLPADEAFIRLAMSKCASGDLSGLLLQEYAEEICHGEYSFVFIDGQLSHAVLKVPQLGDFRCQKRFGGTTKQIGLEDVPAKAIETSRKVMCYLQSRFGINREGRNETNAQQLLYVRVDGIMKGRAFYLMEVEAIEPELWLHSGNGAGRIEQLCGILLQ